MKKRISFWRGLALAVCIALAVNAGCKKEEQPAEKSSGQAVSTYASDSVYLEIKKKIQDNPKDADSWFHLGDLYFRDAQYAQAVEAFQKTVEFKPDMGYAYVKMGTAYDRMNKPAEAIRALEQASKYMPEYPVIYNNMGVAYGKIGKFPEEAASLKKALKLRPRYAAAEYNLGITYMKMKNRKAAMGAYESLKKYDEGTAAALLKELDKTPSGG